MRNRKIIASILIVAGYFLIMLPAILDQFSRIEQTSTIAGFENDVNTMDEEQKETIKNQCIIYNKKIANQHAEEFYHYSGSQEFTNDYTSWPNNTSDITTLKIPKIDVALAVGHGTSEETLQNKAGHLYGTSLPCGGRSSHMVISGHTALRSSKMFDRLVELEIGDEFEVTYMDEVHTYRVDQIKVVKPEEHDQYLQVIPDKDYVTLYTCTPYGINTHRLLVRGERIGTRENIIEDSGQLTFRTDMIKPIVKLTGMALVPLVAVYFVNRKKK